MTNSPSSTVVIGVGNEFRGDDGGGITVVRLLRELLPPEARVIEESGEGTSLLDAWRGATAVVLVDAVQSAAAPGTVYRFDASDNALPSGVFPCSTHAFGVAEAIEMARALHELPPRLIVYGIEGENFASVKGLSPAVEQAVAKVVERVISELRTASTFE